MKSGTETEGKAIQRLPHLGIHPKYSYQTPTLLWIANKYLLTGARYCCLLRGSASARQIQMWILTVIHLPEHRVPNEGARESIQGVEGVCSPIGGTTI